MVHYRHIFFLLIPLLIACENRYTRHDPSLVVEGWIDAGGHPVVLIHTTYAFNSDNGSYQTMEDIMEEHLLPFAKVTVSDGTQEVVLTGRVDTFFMPPYSYSSLNMTGEEGKTYTVSVKYNALYATAVTTIPPRAVFDSVCIEKADTTARLTGYMSHLNTADTTCYAVFAREYGKKRYRLCPLGVFSSLQASADGQLQVPLYNPFAAASSSLTDRVPTLDFPLTGQPLYIKLSRLDADAYRFWNGWVQQTLTQGILFVPVWQNLHNNIDGGIGNWSGLGSTVYEITL